MVSSYIVEKYVDPAEVAAYIAKCRNLPHAHRIVHRTRRVQMMDADTDLVWKFSDKVRPIQMTLRTNDRVHCVHRPTNTNRRVLGQREDRCLLTKPGFRKTYQEASKGSGARVRQQN
jgi:hypothetical protein